MTELILLNTVWIFKTNILKIGLWKEKQMSEKHEYVVNGKQLLLNFIAATKMIFPEE